MSQMQSTFMDIFKQQKQDESGIQPVLGRGLIPLVTFLNLLMSEEQIRKGQA